MTIGCAQPASTDETPNPSEGYLVVCLTDEQGKPVDGTFTVIGSDGTQITHTTNPGTGCHGFNVPPATYGAVAVAACHADGHAVNAAVAVQNTIQRVYIVVPTLQLQIAAESALVPLRRSYTSAGRKMLTFTAPGADTGQMFRISVNQPFVNLYVSSSGNNPFIGAGNGVIPAQAVSGAGLTLYAEASGSSTTVNDVEVTFEGWDTQNGTAQACGAAQSLTAVDVPVRIFSTRTMSGIDPAPIPPPASYTSGRTLHVQTPSGLQGRALVIIGPAAPAAFPVAIQVIGNSTALQLFPNERPTTGETAFPSGAHFGVADIPSTGLRLWAEGEAVSATVGDTGLRVGIDSADPEIDKVAATVVQFSNLAATLPATQPHTLGGNNGNDGVMSWPANAAVPNQVFPVGSAAGTNAFDTDFGRNAPLVLLNGTVTPTNPASIAVQVTPAGIPVTWSVLRDSTDDPSLATRGANTKPSLGSSTGLSATLLSDSVGSFRVRAFVDVNGDQIYDEGADWEPFAVMNLVLVQVTQFRPDMSMRFSPAAGAAESQQGQHHTRRPGGRSTARRHRLSQPASEPSERQSSVELRRPSRFLDQHEQGGNAHKFAV